jgi:hypothetical protein
LGHIALLAVALAAPAIKFSLSDPSPELFDHLSQAGIGLLVAFSVTLGSVGLGSDTHEGHVGWLGYGCGIGSAGLIGIAGCLALSSKAASAPVAVDLLCLAWAIVALVFLGLVVVLGPLMIYESRARDSGS